MAALLLAVMVTVATQTAMSGRWIVDHRAPHCVESGCSDGGGAKILCGESLTIQMRQTFMKIERVVNGETLSMEFPFDGSPVKHPIPVCREFRDNDAVMAEVAILMERLAKSGFDKTTTRATRDGATIVLKSSSGTATSTSERTQVLRITALGHLVVETESALNGFKSSTGRMVYARIKTDR
jgi:hypothetical protein